MNNRKRFVVPLPGGRSLELGVRTLVMGILNVTPDSFAGGGVRPDVDRAVDDGLRMLAEGADIIDVGGESTRPGAQPVDADVELKRVLPVVERLAAARALVSIDTYKAVVAQEALARGALIVNDISGLQLDHDLGTCVARAGAAIVLMHNRGRSRDMYLHAEYQDVPAEISGELRLAMERARNAGIRDDCIVLDPGLGFAKRARQSYEALAQLEKVAALDRPVLSGPSRKSFLKEALGDKPPGERDWGTAAAVAASVFLGAHIVRVHAVAPMADVVRVADRIRAASTAASPGSGTSDAARR